MNESQKNNKPEEMRLNIECQNYLVGILNKGHKYTVIKDNIQEAREAGFVNGIRLAALVYGDKIHIPLMQVNNNIIVILN